MARQRRLFVSRENKLDDDEILAIIASELARANYSSTDQGYGQLEESMHYYLGLPNGTEVDGRSTVTSTDVADTIEWILPQIMESFTQVNEIVKFDPKNSNDSRQAELESQFVYDILMKENEGFVLIHQMVKDALMQRNGILKVYYEKIPHIETARYTGVTDEGLAVLAQQDDIEIVEVSGNQGQFDVKIARHSLQGKIVIACVPLEEFRINAQHNSINANTARFTAHVVTKTISDLAEEGYAEEILDKLPAYHNYRRDYRFAMMHENSTGALAQSADESQKYVQVHECFMAIDIDGDGIAELMKITCAGSTDVPEVILSKEALDDKPWISTTGILMSHKFQGLSITDRVRQIQAHKTAIWRNILDNMYLQNNQRNVVLEGQVNIDDLLISRPGGLIRAKRLDAIAPLQTPQISNVAFDMMRYLDEVRAGRTGVQADGNASPIAVGDRVGSQGVDRLLNAKEALVGLIIRVIAETAIKPLMCKIRKLAVQHLDAVQDYEFRGEWVKIAPAYWINHRNCTVRVGTGTGDSAEKLATLNSILSFQANAIQNPQQVLVDQKNIFNTLDDICKAAGLNGANRYFIDPDTDAGKQKSAQIQQSTNQASQKQEQAQLAQLQMESKLAESALITANAQTKATEYKAQADFAKHQLNVVKFNADNEIAQLKQQLEQMKSGIDAQHKLEQLTQKHQEFLIDKAIELTQIEAQAAADENENYKQNLDSINEPI